MTETDEKPLKMFEVCGPFAICTTKGKAARYIAKNDADSFWNTNAAVQELSQRVGCYIFAIRASKGFRPVYVGKTVKGFEKEIFQLHKLQKYNEELHEIVKGTPVMFFVVHPEGKGIPNSKMIGDLEDFLIQVAVAKNPGLRNIRGIIEKRWGIRGVLRSGQGGSNQASWDFKTAMGLKRK